MSSAVADGTVFSVGPLLSLPEVHNQLFSFAHVQRETVVLAP